jgi:hypothetical protein
MDQRPEFSKCLILTTVAKQFEKATFLPPSSTTRAGAQLLLIGQRAHNPAIYQEPCGNNDIAARVYSSI